MSWTSLALNHEIVTYFFIFLSYIRLWPLRGRDYLSGVQPLVPGFNVSILVSCLVVHHVTDKDRQPVCLLWVTRDSSDKSQMWTCLSLNSLVLRLLVGTQNHHKMKRLLMNWTGVLPIWPTHLWLHAVLNDGFSDKFPRIAEWFH